MSKATLVMVLAGCSLFNASCFAASISEQLENKLNICRQEYKDLVATTNEELRKLKEKAPSNFPTIYKQKQNKLKQKADSCKKIKKSLESAKDFDRRALPAKQAQAIQKSGPQFRCFQLGQNWSEFEACAKSIGYEPQLAETKNKEIAFTVSGNKIGALLDETYHVKFLQFDGGDFWGTTRFDNHFLQAFVNNYNIDELTPDSKPNPLAILGANVGPVVYYKGNISGGTIEITPDYLRVIVEKTSPNSGYKF